VARQTSHDGRRRSSGVSAERTRAGRPTQDLHPLASPAGTTPATGTDWTRNNARVAGLLYLVTFAASIPAVLLLAPVLNDRAYILGAGDETRVLVGRLLDTVNALACIGTAVAVFPVVRRQNESLALGFVTSRMFEAAVIMIGVVSLLAVVSLRQEAASAVRVDPTTLATTGQALVSVRDWTFQFGPNLCSAINALLFGTLLYRSRLAPRIIPAMGLVGAPLLIAATVATVLGLTEQGSIWFLGALPIAAWELSVGLWMAVKGFRPSPVTGTP
jgi:hypothetical protein